MKTVYRDGMVTCSILTDEEAKQYKDMPVGITQTIDMIRIVAENEKKKQILEITASGLNHIKIKKNQ